MSKLALVVDDSLVIRKMVSMALTGAGYEVVVANNGQDALEKAVARRFGVVITDLNMPVMDGLDFIRALREESAYRFTPVVFLTTETDEALQADARKAGATAWLQKPFQAEKVVSLVERIYPA